MTLVACSKCGQQISDVVETCPDCGHPQPKKAADPRVWYFAAGKQKVGPFSWEQFQQLAIAGLLLSSEMVWLEGDRFWTRAGQIKGLFPPSASPSPETPLTAHLQDAGTGMPAGSFLPPSATASPRMPATLTSELRAAEPVPQGLPAPQPASLLDLAIAVGVAIAIPCWLLNEFLGKGFLFLAGVLWLVFATRVVATGTIADFRGQLRRSLLAKAFGLVVGLFGVLVLGVGFFSLLNSFNLSNSNLKTEGVVHDESIMVLSDGTITYQFANRVVSPEACKSKARRSLTPGISCSTARGPESSRSPTSRTWSTPR